MLLAKLVVTLTFFCLVSGQNYHLNTTYSGSSFFDGWNFITSNDPTNGVVDYTDRTTAQNRGLIAVINGKVKIAADMNNKYPTGRGRPSVRIETKTRYNSGLFIYDIDHMPTGPGSWPAFWAYGDNWPNNGEVDILEGIDGMDFNAMTLHTRQDCSMSQDDNTLFSGHWADGSNGQPATNCWVGAPNQYSNQGCSIQGPSGTFGNRFNQAGGGVFVAEWDRNNFIKVWVFLRGQVPSDIAQGNPNPSNWGTPMAYFRIGSSCSPDHFNMLTVVINLTFCGDWAGNAYPGGPQACESTVRDNPQLFTDAYWIINYLKVYSR